MNFFRYLKSVYDYAIFLWEDRDWDGAFVYRFLGFKLKRTEYELDHNGHLEKNEDYRKYMKALRICIKLCKRLYEYNYGHTLYGNISNKWGETVVSFGKEKEDGSKQMFMERPRATTEEEKKKVNQEIIEVGRLSEELRIRDKKWLFNTMNKYIDYWWD